MFGTWHGNAGIDAVQIWEVQQYVKSFVSISYLVIDGKKSFSFAEDRDFSSKDGMFMGFPVWWRLYDRDLKFS
jgi:hypothetical protein